jgi:hypothetical protein
VFVYVGVVVVVPQLDFAAMALELGKCFELAPRRPLHRLDNPTRYLKHNLCALSQRGATASQTNYVCF